LTILSDKIRISSAPAALMFPDQAFSSDSLLIVL
jgi:hypothetical protein